MSMKSFKDDSPRPHADRTVLLESKVEKIGTSRWRERISMILAIAAFGLAVSAFGPLSAKCWIVFDDHNAIRTNPDVLYEPVKVEAANGVEMEEEILGAPPPGSMLALLTNDFWGRPLWSKSSHKSYRPVTVLTYRIESSMFESEHEKVRSMHITNVILHGTASALVSVLAEDLHIGLVASMLFALHPVHVEAVTGLVGRAELLCCIFYITGYLAFRKARDSIGKNSIVLWTFFVLSLYLATMSKEIGITLPILGIGAVISEALAARQFKQRDALAIVFLLLSCFPYFALRFWLCGGIDLGGSGLIRKAENPLFFVEDWWFRILSISVVLLKYFELLVYPTGFSPEYSFNCLPMVESWGDPRLPWLLILPSGILVIVLLCLREIFAKRKTYLAIYFGWFLAPFLPSSHIFVTVGTLVAERVLYIPSVGFCLLAARAIKYFADTISKGFGRSDFSRDAWLGAILSIILGFLWIMCSEQIITWTTDDTLFRAAEKVCPGSAKVQTQLFHLDFANHDLVNARKHLEKAESIYPEWCDLGYLFGMLLIREGRIQEGKERLISQLECPFTTEKSLKLLQQVWSLESSGGKNISPQVYEEKGRVYELANNTKLALIDYRSAAVAAANVQNFKLAESVLKRVEGLVTNFGLDKENICFVKYWVGKSYPLNQSKQGDRVLERAEDLFRSILECESTLAGGISALVDVYILLVNRDKSQPEVLARLADVLALAVTKVSGPDVHGLHEYAVKANQAWTRCELLATDQSKPKLLQHCRLRREEFLLHPNVRALLKSTKP